MTLTYAYYDTTPLVFSGQHSQPPNPPPHTSVNGNHHPLTMPLNLISSTILSSLPDPTLKAILNLKAKLNTECAA